MMRAADARGGALPPPGGCHGCAAAGAGAACACGAAAAACQCGPGCGAPRLGGAGSPIPRWDSAMASEPPARRGAAASAAPPAPQAPHAAAGCCDGGAGDAGGGGLQHADSAFDICADGDQGAPAGGAQARGAPGSTPPQLQRRRLQEQPQHQQQQDIADKEEDQEQSQREQHQQGESVPAAALPRPRSMAHLLVPADPARPADAPRRPPARRPSRIVVSSAAEHGGREGAAPRVFVAIPKAPAAGGPLPLSALRHAISDGSHLVAATAAARRLAGAPEEDGAAHGPRRPPQRRASVIALPSYVRRALRLGPLPGAGVGEEGEGDAAESAPPGAEPRSTSADALPPVANAAAAAAAQLLSSAGEAGWARVAAPPGPKPGGSNVPLPLVVVGAEGGDAAVAPEAPAATAATAPPTATAGAAAHAGAAADERAEGGDAGDEDACSSSSLEEWWCAPPTGLSVCDVMAGPPTFIDASADAASARALMASNGTAVLLVDRGPAAPPGLIEERDLFRLPALLRARSGGRGGRRPHGGAGVPASALMHTNVVVVAAGDSIEAAAQALQDADARRAVVRRGGGGGGGAGAGGGEGGEEAGGGDGGSDCGRAAWVGTISEGAIYR
jgi:CBS domain-containing protein